MTIKHSPSHEYEHHVMMIYEWATSVVATRCFGMIKVFCSESDIVLTIRGVISVNYHVHTTIQTRPSKKMQWWRDVRRINR
jgi:hypothetical protein